MDFGRLLRRLRLFLAVGARGPQRAAEDRRERAGGAARLREQLPAAPASGGGHGTGTARKRPESRTFSVVFMLLYAFFVLFYPFSSVFHGFSVDSPRVFCRISMDFKGFSRGFATWTEALGGQGPAGGEAEGLRLPHAGGGRQQAAGHGPLGPAGAAGVPGRAKIWLESWSFFGDIRRLVRPYRGRIGYRTG